jgi:pimeloyl-ACP methyl ester carboxylesterase
VDDLIQQIRQIDLKDVVLVGHSYAGAVVGAVARRMPERFRAQVYVDTFPLEEGKSFLDEFSPEGKEKFQSSIVMWNGTRVWPMPEPLNSQAPTEGLGESDLNLLRKKGTPHPAKTFEETLSGPVAKAPQPQKYAISCVEDENAGKAEKEEFLKNYPDWSYYSIPSICHWPMLSSPKELASILAQVGKI